MFTEKIKLIMNQPYEFQRTTVLKQTTKTKHGETTMNETKRRILSDELAGTIFIITLGTILHFTFEWSGNQPIVGIFSAVNESVWEHLKLGFWPATTFALIEYRYLKSNSNFLTAKTTGIYLIPITITAVFYSYTAILHETILAIDILTFIIAVIASQLASYKLLTWKTLPPNLNKIALTALILLGLAFVLFTFYPPHIGPFQDPITDAYGIPSQ
jgi:hypothetical protein